MEVRSGETEPSRRRHPVYYLRASHTFRMARRAKIPTRPGGKLADRPAMASRHHRAASRPVPLHRLSAPDFRLDWRVNKERGRPRPLETGRPVPRTSAPVPSRDIPRRIETTAGREDATPLFQLAVAFSSDRQRRATPTRGRATRVKLPYDRVHPPLLPGRHPLTR